MNVAFHTIKITHAYITNNFDAKKEEIIAALTVEATDLDMVVLLDQTELLITGNSVEEVANFIAEFKKNYKSIIDLYESLKN